MIFPDIHNNLTLEKENKIWKAAIKIMACYVPFNNKNLDISFFVFKPTIVCVDDLIQTLKQFSLYTDSESLGCVHSSIFTSIHGNKIIWYGAWMKRTDEKRNLLSATLVSILRNIASMAILINHSFFEAFAGESKDGSPAAKFFTGDIISIRSATLPLSDENSNENRVWYACLAIFKDRFDKMSGVRAGVCFRSQSMPRLLGLFVWESLGLCYKHILTSNYQTTVHPYLDGLDIDVKYDVFRVVYVSGDRNLSFQFDKMLGDEVDKNEEAYDEI